MIHHLIRGPYFGTFWLKALAMGIVLALLTTVLSVWLLSCWFEAHANTTARIQALERKVAYLEGAARPLVQVEDGGYVSILAGGGE